VAAPRKPVAGDVADPAFWTAEVYDKWVAAYAAWTAYTPTWSTSNATQPAIGNGTLTGRYRAIGKTVWFSLRFIAGSSTTFGDGLWAFSLPVGYAPTAIQAASGVIVGSSSLRQPVAAWLSTGTGIFRILTLAGSGGVRTNPLATDVPFEWGNGHQIYLGGVYEAS
jgi:hypothetical protein